MDAAVEKAWLARWRSNRPRQSSSKLTESAPVRSAIAWVIWSASVLTVLVWIAIAVVPQPVHDEVYPWWFRVSSWVQVLALITVGRLIVSRYPRHAIGWSFVAAGLFLGLYSGTRELLQLQSVPLLPLVEWLVGTRWLWIPGVGLLTVVVPLLFPDGRPLSRAWYPALWGALLWLAALTLARIVRPGPLLDVPRRRNPIGAAGALGHVASGVADHALALWPVFLLLALAGLLARFRHLPDDDRARALQLTIAMSAMVALLAADKVVQQVTGHELPTLFYLSAAAQVLMPVVAALAVLRFRLYGIDVVVERTVLYGALAAFIGAVYVAVVWGVGALFSRGSGPRAVLPLVATTVVAIAFQPARDRVQRLASRLVYGKRATPYEVLSRFSREMARSIADDAFFRRTTQVVAEGIGAQSVELWLSSGPHLHLAAAYPDPAPSSNEGHEDRHGAQQSDIRTVQIRYRADLLGELVVRKRPGDRFRSMDSKLLSEVAQQATLVLANGRLATELSARLDELKASRARIVAATDTERCRLERDLHDGAQQRLVNLSLLLGLLDTRASSEHNDAVRELIGEARSEANEALRELRDLARGIHPAILTEAGLGPAIRSLGERCKISVDVIEVPDSRLPPAVEVATYFVVAEALANAVKHARATRVTARVSLARHGLTVEVTDDGVGGASVDGGTGLRGLVDRVGAVDGTLVVRSRPGAGTTVLAQIPCE